MKRNRERDKAIKKKMKSSRRLANKVRLFNTRWSQGKFPPDQTIVTLVENAFNANDNEVFSSLEMLLDSLKLVRAKVEHIELAAVLSYNKCKGRITINEVYSRIDYITNKALIKEMINNGKERKERDSAVVFKQRSTNTKGRS